ncbi:MAG TPA: hypothetical protein VJJ46_00085, partial [Anaerolineales bacterium]|nr:hypothetical protein [Anaerolineales bacterium]
IDFRAIRAQLNQQGRDLAFVKIGFHVGPGGNRTGLGTWEACLDAAGVPFFLKSVDDAGAIVEGLRYRLQSGVPHVLVFRRSGGIYDVPPEYYASPRPSPQLVAEAHWQRHRDELLRMFPAEIVLSNGLRIPRETYMRFVWIETINEVNKGPVTGTEESEWWADFAYYTAILAMQDGFNWAAFSWSTGEPESIHWQGPQMRRFLELAANNPDRIAIALHEYSLCDSSLSNLDLGAGRPCPGAPGAYPDLVGRLRRLYDTTDGWGLPRPIVLITEFGWGPTEVPSPDAAFDRDGQPGVDNIPWAAGFYAQYPEVLGAAIWYLGPGYDGIAHQAQRLIGPLTEYALQEYFVVP